MPSYGQSAAQYKTTPNPIQALTITDFTGGLNLRAGPLQLLPNEASTALNVDFLLSGGVRRRRVFKDWVDYDASDAQAEYITGPVWAYTTPGGAETIVANASGELLVGTSSGGGQWVLTHLATAPDYLGNSNADVHGNVFGKSAEGTGDNFLYIVDGDRSPSVSWDGTTLVQLTADNYNEDFTAPASDSMPKAKYIASFSNHQFVAYTFESGGTFRDRVRFSHPGGGADFRALDYIDIDSGANDDFIVGLLPFADRLLIFKRNSIYAVYGFDADTFSVVQISGSGGAMSQESVVSTDYGVYFFSLQHGLMLYDGVSLPVQVSTHVWLDEPISGDGSLKQFYPQTLGAPHVAWIDRKVWVIGGFNGQTGSRIFVLDPSLRRRVRGMPTTEGAWTLYATSEGIRYPFRIQGFDYLVSAAAGDSTGGIVWYVDVQGVSDGMDSFRTATGVSAETDITSYFTGAWYDVGNSAVVKRWKRPEFIVRTGLSGTLAVNVYHDYDPSNVKRMLTVDTHGVGVSNSAVFDTAVFDTAVFGGDSEAGEAIVRVPILGRARAVQFKITGPTPSERWTLDGIILKFIPRRIRG